MWYVYLLKSLNFKKSYVGCTNDVQNRIKEHNAGKSFYTKRFLPWELIKVEEFETYEEARQRERFYKSGIGRLELKGIFNNLRD